MDNIRRFNPRSLALLALLAVALFGCGPRRVEKYHEDGFEVLDNRLEPYRIPGQPSFLRLEEVLVLDTEDPDIAAVGLLDIMAIEVDSEGGIYFLSHHGEKHFFFKFSHDGRFLTSFGARGQGPGEMEFPLMPRMMPGNRLTVTDVLKKRMVFNEEGRLVSETRIDPNFVIVHPMDNGNSVVFWKAGAEDAANEYFKEKISLFSPEGQEIQELDELKIARKVSFLDPVFAWRIGRDRIYQTNQQRGYEIRVYDGEGAGIIKIRKRYQPVRLTAEKREALLQGVSEDSPLKNPAVCPEYLPPVHTLFPDGEGRLFAVTFEEGDRPDEYRCDIFNPGGEFIARTSLPVQHSRAPFPVYGLAKNQYLYCVGEKENGFQRLKVFRMIWQKEVDG